MSTHDHDNDAPPGEDELKALYRSLPRKEPSPELDRTIKRAAADAVRSARRRPATRWPVAVASVAMVVVAAGLGWRMIQQPSSVPQIPSASSVAAKAPPLPAPTATAPPVPASQPSPQVAEPAPPPPILEQQLAPRPLSPAHDNIRSAMKPKVMARVAAQAAPPPPTAALEASAPAAPMREENANAAYAPMQAPAPAAPAPPAPPAPVEAAPAAIAPPALASSAYTAPIGGMSRRAASMPAMQAPAPMPAQDATAMNPADTPAQELEKIRQLFALHRHDEAMQRLAAFRKAHPDTPLPDDLQAQLSDHE